MKITGTTNSVGDIQIAPPSTFTISYETEYGTAPATKTVNLGYALTSEDLSEISASGHTFDGWYNEDTDTKYEVGYVVVSNITLTARWDTPITGIFGVNWLGTSSSAMTRTDDAVDFDEPVPYVNGMSGTPSSPFDNISPWKDMEIVDDAVGKLVKIPKYWYKWTRTGDAMKLQISNTQQTGFLVSPAHADRGDGVGERDFVYIGRYHCSTSDYKSTSGVKPKANITRATARTAIHNLGTNIWQFDYAMFWTVNMLYLVEYADWDSQAKIGYGCGNGSTSENSGKTDSMPYHTGTMQSAKTTYGTGIQYRYIEDWWANVYDWVDGIYFSNTNIYAIKNPSAFSDTSGGTNVGTRAGSDGYIKSWTNPTATGYEHFLYPNSVVSSISYVRDYCVFVSGGVVLFFGGYWYQGEGRGAFYLNGNSSASSSSSDIGCRLQKLP